MLQIDTQNWHRMPTQMLLEQAWELIKDDHDSPAARCISALTWRLKSSEEWIDGLEARLPREAR